MLKITIYGKESFNNKTQEFVKPTFDKVTLQLEHSLVSLSKWESMHHKPFLTNDEKTTSEVKDYIKCMTVTPYNVDPIVYEYFTNYDIKKVNDYIADSMTATWFNEQNNKTGKAPRKPEQITSELIYYWMISCQIPFECEKWHLNRLLTLIKVCNIKNNASNNKMSKQDTLMQNRSLNAARRKRFNTKG